MDQDTKIREDPKKQTKEAPEQLSDILLVMDTQRKTIGVASDKGGKPKTVPVDEKHQDAFLKIDKSNILANFISNYLRQANDPTHFRFFRVPMAAVRNSMKLFRELLKDNPSVEAQALARQFEVKPEKIQGHDQDKEQSNSHHNSKSKEMDTTSQNRGNQTSSQEQAETPKYRFQDERINWDEIKKFGISKEYLQEKKLLDGMMKGYKSEQALPVSLNFGSVILKTDARLSFQQAENGQVALAIHGIRKQPELDRPYFGHVFSEEDKKNLKETGNMGRVVELTSRSGEIAPYLLSIDKITNEIVAARADKMFIPDEVSKVKLSEDEKNSLREGKAIFVEGMTSKSGKEFSATIQMNAEKRSIEYRFDNSGQFNRQEIGGVKLTDKQMDDLNTGKTIFVEDMKKKNGESFSSFITMNEKGGLSYTNYNPNSPEGSREIYIPKEVCGVRLTPEDKDTLREGKPVFLDNMVNRKGDEFSSFVKIDTETGRMSFARTQDGFAERQQFKIPAEVWGVTLKATERADLQDGKAIFVENMQGFKGQFSSWIKVNENQGKLDYYTENPDKPKQAASQHNRQKNNQSEKQDNKREKAEKQENKRTTRQRM